MSLRSGVPFLSYLLIIALAPPANAASLSFKEVTRSGTEAGATDACVGHLVTVHGTDRGSIERSLSKELQEFRTLAERALALRAETIKAGKQIKERMEQGKPLSGDDLVLLNQGVVDHLALRQELLSIAQAHECWLDASEKELEALGMTPETRLKGVMLSLSAALVLYDNYLLAVTLFEGDGKLRRLLNEGDPSFAVNSAALAKVTLNYNSVSNRKRVRKAITFYEGQLKRLLPMLAKNDDTDYVNTLITQSPSYTIVKQWSPFYVIGRKLGFLGAVTADTLAGFDREGINLFSMVFGNAVGLVETRKGKLDGRGDVLADIRRNLRVGDILLEKTPFRLTDKLIPGYWGHAAVWIGTEEELRELGVWNDPLVARFQEEIRQGKGVVEALRSGVEINSLEHFLNIDSIGVLRKAGLSREEQARIVAQVLRQMGKPYDFNFDVESKGRMYCSKLIYLSYSGVEWSTKRSLGRTTFTPDDVAFKAVDDSTLQLITLYHDGNRVTNNPLEVMAKLMGVASGKPVSRR